MKAAKLIMFGLATTMLLGVSAQADDEKVLTFGCQMYGDGLIDPVSTVDRGWNCTRFAVGECLFKFNDDMVPEGNLVESYESSEDLQTWTLKIKEGIKFSDGCDLTATKVKESLDRALELGPDGSAGIGKYLEYGTVVTADDAAGTVTLELPSPKLNTPGNLCYPVMAITDVEHTEDWDSGVIGTGPYKVDSFTDQTGYSMSKNEYYREEVPYDKVEILFMGDASAKAMALESGQVDLVENISNIESLNKLKENSDYTVDVASGVRCGFSWINFNGVLANDTLRQAVEMAMDHDAICASASIGGLYTSGFSVLPSTLAYGYDELTNPYTYDVEGACKLLDDAGIVDNDGDGIRELDGQNIVLKYVSYDARLLNDFSDLNSLLLGQIGIGVEADYGSSDDQWNKLVAGEYDLNNNNWTTVGNGDPTEYMANWYSTSASNYCGYASEDYDALYDAFTASVDQDERADLLKQMQQILIDDAAVIIDGYYNSSMAYNNATVGYAHIHTADYYWITTEIVPVA